MKKMFLLRSILIASIGLAIATTMFTSCKDENKTNSADKTALNAKIKECEDVLNAATTTQYPQTAIDAFKATIQDVKLLVATDLTQTAADNAVEALEQAKTTFLAAAYGAIPASALMLGLTFDETVTNDEITAEGKGSLKAKLTAGPSEIFGNDAAKPTFVEGKQGKAMKFAKGGHLAIADYTPTDFMGQKLSIAVWVKPDSTRGGNYIASLNYWNTWKFQVQEQNKPFFTIKTTKGGVDADNEADFSAKNNEWTHLVVTLDLVTKKLTFFVNGILSKEWTDVTKENLEGTLTAYTPADGTAKLPLIIGAATTYSEAVAGWTTWDGWKTPNGWDHFVGAMDNFKIYNIALTEGQVTKLYNDEK